MIFGDLADLKFPDICLTGEEKPRKTSPRKPVPTGDRTRARCVTGAHATTCSTAMDTIIDNNSNHYHSVLPKGRSSTANSGTKVAVLLGMNRCGSFPLLSALHSLFGI